jgi:RHS repeat-associated protein
MITAGGVTYTYDGDGRRVEKSNGKIYWYGKNGEVLNESDLSGTMTEAYVYFDGKRIGHHNSSRQYFYYAEDFIGSSRVITTSAGATCYDADFYPFGAESPVTNTCPQNYKWTGKERDAETGNDDFDARYYSSTYGRFLSADWSDMPAPVPYANLTNPQTLNLYAIVRDNPESFADLDGHDYICWSCVVEKVGNFLASPRGKQLVSGTLNVAAGIATVASILAPEAKPVAVALGAMAGTANFVKGTTQIMGSATNTDTKDAEKALDAVSTPTGTAAVILTGGNVNAGAAASTIQDVATIVAHPGDLKSVAGAANLPGTATGAANLAKDTAKTVKNVTTPPPQPNAPRPPAGSTTRTNSCAVDQCR